MFAYEEAARILHSHFYESYDRGPSFDNILTSLKETRSRFVTINCVSNFKYIKLEAEEIRSILNLNDSVDFPTMYIFDDGEVHFNGQVHSFEKGMYDDYQKRIKFKHAFVLPYLKKLHIYQDGKDLGIKEVSYIKDGYYNIGYGSVRLKVRPGDWVFDGIHLDYKRGQDLKVYAIEPRTGKKVIPGTFFSK